MERKIITTSDGSHSIYIPELDENYHSVHGAIQESKHVFIEAGLKYSLPRFSEINILEIGFGTGLNALLTLIESNNSKSNIHYTSIEAFPVSMEMANELNYVSLLNEEEVDLKTIFNRLHSCEWEIDNRISGNFSLRKIKDTLQKTGFGNEEFNLIYFDAFGPPTQPEMWTEEIFSKLYSALTHNGSLVTYCAKGEVKRTLKKVGFRVETLPGPPGKREMVRAVRE
jgi:tRNA U34 5-methylaminomethyl-2-thiouridine-forming methyltransferase MnmC